jgi:hypothetical protein
MLAWVIDETESSDSGSQVLIAFNAHWEPRALALPPLEGALWFRVMDSALSGEDCFASRGAEAEIEPKDSYLLSARSAIMLLAR